MVSITAGVVPPRDGSLIVLGDAGYRAALCEAGALLHPVGGRAILDRHSAGDTLMRDVQPAPGPPAETGGLSPEIASPLEGDFSLNNFQFTAGETLAALRIHYRTLGEPRRDGRGVVDNAVLLLHGTGGSGGQFMTPEFAGELFGPGQPLDVSRYFVVLPDGIGHGGSSKPSDGAHARFPRYGYRDMVAAQYRLLTAGLEVNHLRLIIGTSMGGMHTWLWGEIYPAFMDALLPLASLPTQICGRNRIWRRAISDAIRNDPQWRGGEYREQPPSLRTAAQILFLMGSNSLLRCQLMPSLTDSDAVLDAAVEVAVKQADANDLLYQIEASHDYDPGPCLEQIRAPLLALNWADDLINPAELGILEREIQRVAQGRAVIIPFTAQTRGHESHSIAAPWKHHLMQLLLSAPYR
jgi:homoserine O-acetyltransferase